ncbi:hypothetical protein PhCBS80983_g04916 [Powellomyces hirtus]|uniref:GPI mannosyltransferase 2 n=1 Tax=Powellomyces hirtus TaxID=109895 RepID=A0A507DXN4_9FUNG|nr:hypothetical protein PhCBS80983_g04916 [Powellomyces hirtus]
MAVTESETAVVWRAITVRVLLCTLAVISSSLAGDYDVSTTVSLVASRSGSHAAEGKDELATSLLTPFVRWDAVYFLSIAQRGYIYEQEFAFFPGLPTLMRAVAACIQFHASLGEQPALILAGLIISNASFVGAAVVLYRLGCRILRDERLAFRAAILFTITPAGLFMSSIYTESLFALLSFSGMLYFTKSRYLPAALLWAAATSVRANGMLHAGFFVWEFIVLPISSQKKVDIRALILGTVRAAGYGAIAIAPFVAFQMYAYNLFCQRSGVAQRSWCGRQLPLIYSFVQKEYWNNGFLSYYEVKQIPNFILAAPVFAISITGVIDFMSQNPTSFFSLGILSKQRTDLQAPYIYLWAFMTLYCATMMHVQVVVRFFTSVPSFYWFAAKIASGQVGTRWATKAVVPYFLLYGMVTTLLFANFLPPA